MLVISGASSPDAAANPILPPNNPSVDVSPQVLAACTFSPVDDTSAQCIDSVLHNINDARWLEGVSSIGITAGASAPEDLVQKLIERLRELADVDLQTSPGITENVRFRMPVELAEMSA